MGSASRVGRRLGAGGLVLFHTSAVSAAPGAAPGHSADGVWALVANADVIVQGVMLLLVAASVATWALWLIKGIELRQARAALDEDIQTLNGAAALPQPGSLRFDATGEMIDIAKAELARAGGAARALEGAEERVAAQLPLVEGRAIYRMLWGTNILASIGSSAPFIGLAGTVWGIMNSFLNISQSQSTSLAVVAPGIAEALIATALGLAAAIPAVLIYNFLARSIARCRRQLNEISVLIACVVSREAEKRAGEPGGEHGSHIVSLAVPQGR